MEERIRQNGTVRSFLWKQYKINYIYLMKSISEGEVGVWQRIVAIIKRQLLYRQFF